MFKREYEEHRKQFEKFIAVLIIECDNCINVEKLFKKEIKLRNLNREIVIKGKNQTELFAVTAKFTHDYFIEHLKKLVVEHKLPAIKDAEKQIVCLNTVVDVYQNHFDITKLDKEIQKQIYDFKNSDNYKAELATHVKLAEIHLSERDKDIELKNKEIELKKLHIKQIAMEKNIPVEITEVRPVQQQVVKRKSRKEIIDL